jgi:Arc/MetJ family transcription regulator
MRTNIVLEDDLVAEAQRLTGIRTKRALVAEALRTLIATRRRKSLLELQGRVEFYAGFDHKVLREGRR